MTDVNRPEPFDERAALDELERLAEKIQSSRRQRAQAVDEFDAFVRGFKNDRWSGPERRAPETPLRPPPTPAVDRQATVDRQAVMPPPPIVPREELDAPVPPVAVAPSWTDMLKQPIARWTLAGVGLLVIVMLLWRPWSTVPNQPAPISTAAPAAATAPSTSTSQTPAPAVAPPVAKPTRAVNIELVTLRPVWTRVVVDDRKEVERELPAGQRFTFGADRAITVRAGDAGAMRIIYDGKDLGVMGRDGQIASRTFAAAR